MLKVLIAGLPISAKEILEGAMSDVFDGSVEVEELTKENIRSRVRLSSRSVETILVILDGVSSDLCSDIENGLYKSEKYFCYSTDEALAEFLNNKYGLNIVVESPIEEVTLDTPEVSEGYEDLEKLYQEKIQFKDNVIKNLEARIHELSDLYGSIDDEISKVSQEDYDRLKDENIKLNNELLDMSSLKESIAEKEENIKNLEQCKVDLENRIRKMTKNYDEVLSELNDLKVAYSKQAGVIQDKINKISELEKAKRDSSKFEKEISELQDSISEYKNTISTKDAEIGDLRVDIQSKERENTRYLKELESLKGLKGVNDELTSANATIESLKTELSSISSENDDLKKSDKEKDRVISQLSSTNEENLQKIDELGKSISELQDRVKDDDESLALLNKEKIELQNKVSLLEKSGSGKDLEDSGVLQEIQDLRNQLVSVNNNPFTKIGSTALPNSSVGLKILNGSGKFKNVRFAFAGSAESRKGAYRCLLEEFRNSKNDNRYLIVDLVSETSVDYVFEIKNTVSGIEWFRKGGSVQPYVSSTALKNTKVLSAGLGYINDSYFLCIDWAKRLAELENSGYKVVLFCGDISNLVGRVLHESFASYGDSIVYVLGNSVGCRTIVTNLRGLANAKDSVIAYFDYNTAMERFYNMVNKTNECLILSTRGNLRR